MGDAKKLVLKPISSADARRVVRLLHYSRKVCQNSQIHLGVFLGEKCGGALQFGPSLDKRKTIGLVRGTEWDQYIELNRLALADWLPRNSESRSIGVAMRYLRKTYPRLKWVLSYADATQCGDGAIYRASGFVLTDVRRNKDLLRLPDGTIAHTISLKTGYAGMDTYSKTRGSSSVLATGAEPLPGFQLRYVFFLDPSWRARLAVPEIPFSEIRARGAAMYRGGKGSPGDTLPGEGGSSPTPPLQIAIRTP